MRSKKITSLLCKEIHEMYLIQNGATNKEAYTLLEYKKNQMEVIIAMNFKTTSLTSMRNHIKELTLFLQEEASKIINRNSLSKEEEEDLYNQSSLLFLNQL